MTEGCRQKRLCHYPHTLKEDSFSSHCLNTFTFKGVHDICHLTPEKVCALQSSLFFLFLWCQPQIPTVHTPTDHVAHIQAELGCLIWARIQIELLNFHNKINLVSMHTWHLRPLENTLHIQREERQQGRQMSPKTER